MPDPRLLPPPLVFMSQNCLPRPSPSPDGRNAFWGEMEDGDRKLFPEDDDDDDDGADTAIALFTP